MGKSSQILQDCQLIDQIQLCFNISSKNKMFFSVQVVLREGLTRKKKKRGNFHTFGPDLMIRIKLFGI